ncbi:NIPSNAP family protein [Aeromonas veronii]|nr:NIPSNAP family protein [Aeromonas veronii]TNJ04141.1 NIPSNAP family protein [Aeromonas veronii]
MKTVEFLQYTLHPGTGEDFHNIMQDISVPLHRTARIDVVRYGQSEHDPDSYMLVRAFDSLEERTLSLDTFYKSDAWRSGPREDIIQRISISLLSVVSMTLDSVNALRAN